MLLPEDRAAAADAVPLAAGVVQVEEHVAGVAQAEAVVEVVEVVGVVEVVEVVAQVPVVVALVRRAAAVRTTR